MRDEATLVSDALFPDTLEMNGSLFPWLIILIPVSIVTV